MKTIVQYKRLRKVYVKLLGLWLVSSSSEKHAIIAEFRAAIGEIDDNIAFLKSMYNDLY